MPASRWRQFRYAISVFINTCAVYEIKTLPLQSVLKAYQLSSTLTTASSSLDQMNAFRAQLIQSLQPASERAAWTIVNYSRGELGQLPAGNGHVSPVGGYHAESDM